MDSSTKALFLRAAEQIQIDADKETLAAMEGFLARAEALLTVDDDGCLPTERICAPLCAQQDAAPDCLPADALLLNGRFADGYYTVPTVLAPKKPHSAAPPEEGGGDDALA